ncbi:unnamed protein product [Tetraodon nigroviridis]|uniref:(spotted green pufferfish) hypothetical protein n=1 Tax=Tetraodon nigroviridis TaxID=99883 RepID=Q4SX93_TETNG|nr:unnamed protein product [Tetraodon nigroviridis]
MDWRTGLLLLAICWAGEDLHSSSLFTDFYLCLQLILFMFHPVSRC